VPAVHGERVNGAAEPAGFLHHALPDARRAAVREADLLHVVGTGGEGGQDAVGIAEREHAATVAHASRTHHDARPRLAPVIR
jgi:hypothetical protein